MIQPHLLVVDDDDDIREAIELALGAEGYRVASAPDGLSAWSLLESGMRPRLILLDLMMPRWDGEQFLAAMNGSPYTAIPIVIMSGHDTAARHAHERGTIEVLAKPVELERLLALVERYCGARPDILEAPPAL